MFSENTEETVLIPCYKPWCNLLDDNIHKALQLMKKGDNLTMFSTESHFFSLSVLTVHHCQRNTSSFMLWQSSSLLCISCSCAAPVARLKTFSIYYNVSSCGGLHHLPQALSNYPNHLPTSLPQIGGTLTALCSALENIFEPREHNTLHAALKILAELLTRS